MAAPPLPAMEVQPIAHISILMEPKLIGREVGKEFEINNGDEILKMAITQSISWEVFKVEVTKAITPPIVPYERQQYWTVMERKNGTRRPYIKINDHIWQEAVMRRIRETNEIVLYLRDSHGDQPPPPLAAPIPQPIPTTPGGTPTTAATIDPRQVLLIMKYYDYRSQRLWFVGSDLFPKTLRAPDLAPIILNKFRLLPNIDASALESAGITAATAVTDDAGDGKAPQRLVLFDEVNAVHALIVNMLSSSMTLAEQDFRNGDIVCCQELSSAPEHQARDVKNYLACIKFRKQQSALYHPSTFSLADMLNQKKFADVVFTFPHSHHQLYGHRAILALRSMYFRTMFSFADQARDDITRTQTLPLISSSSLHGNGTHGNHAHHHHHTGSDAKSERKRMPIMTSTVLSGPSIVGSSTPHTSSSAAYKRPRPVSPAPISPATPSSSSSSMPTFETPRPFVGGSGKDRTISHTSSSMSTHIRGLDEDEPNLYRLDDNRDNESSSSSYHESSSTTFTSSGAPSSSSSTAAASSNNSSLSVSSRLRDGRHEIIIEDIEYHVFYRMIAYIYGAVPTDDPMSFPLLRQLLALASRYLLEELRMECGRILMWFVAEDSCIELLIDAVQNNCDDLKQACIDFCVAKAARVANFPGFIELCRTDPLLIQTLFQALAVNKQATLTKAEEPPQAKRQRT